MAQGPDLRYVFRLNRHAFFSKRRQSHHAISLHVVHKMQKTAKSEALSGFKKYLVAGAGFEPTTFGL
jgi:hypothetical protein